jgi:hypothetical protein
MKLLLMCGVCVYTFHIHPLKPLSNIQPHLRSASSSTGLRCNAMDGFSTKRSCYLPLDRGMRISRIITVSTSSYDAMLKLKLARSRLEIMKTWVRHRRTSMISDHQQLPLLDDGTHIGWSFHPRHGSPIRSCSGIPNSVLWATDVHTCDTSQVSVGSWIMATMSLSDSNHISSLCTTTSSRICTTFQPVALIRPGFATPDLVCTPSGPLFVITFIELQNCDELGIPTRRLY